MNQYIAFTKKEFLEAVRTRKLLIMFSIFLMIGFMNPLIAKVTPALLEKFMPEGMVIEIADPTAFDSWTQFYSNVIQIGLISLVLVFSGLITNEYNKDTLINVLTKGLNRKNVILSKFTAASVIWTGAYILCFLVTWLYTTVLWSEDSLNNLIQAALYLWVYGIFLITLIILGNSLFKSSIGTLLFVGGLVIIQFLINIITPIQKFNPIMLASDNLNLIAGNLNNSYFVWSLSITLILIITILILSINIFNKREV